MLAAQVLLACMILSQPPQASTFEQAYAKKEKEIVALLANNDVWTDQKQRESLLDALGAAKLFPSTEMIGLLIRHIDFAPFGKDDLKIRTPERIFPAAGALIQIGLPSVPGLLEVLKTSDPEGGLPPRILFDASGTAYLDPKQDGRKRDNKGALRHWLAIYSIVQIYDKAGAGVDLARLRIELELKQANAKERQFLSQALESVLIKKKQ